MLDSERQPSPKQHKHSKILPAPGKLPFAALPRCILADSGLSDRAKVTWAALATWNGCETICPSTAALGWRAGMSRRDVYRGIRELMAAELVSVSGSEKGGRTITRQYLLADAGKLRDRYAVYGNKLRGSSALYSPETARRLSINCATVAHEVDKEVEKKKRAVFFAAEANRIWGDLLRFVTAGGTVTGIPAEAKLTLAVIERMGGFDRLAFTIRSKADCTGLLFLKREFLKLYVDLSADGLTDDWEPQELPLEEKA